MCKQIESRDSNGTSTTQAAVLIGSLMDHLHNPLNTRMRSVYFHRVSADPDSDQEEEKMAFNVARLLNSDESDRAQIDSLVEEYFLEDLTDGSEEDEDANFANYETDENDDFDFRQNDYDTAMEVANRSVETVSDCPDEELRKAKKFRYLSLLF